MSNLEKKAYDTLSFDQKEVYDLVENSKQNVFVSGQGGHGKSYLAKSLQDNKTIVMAPTGVAALNCGGITLHRALGLPVGGVPTMADFEKVPKKAIDLFGVNSPIKKIQIDELGMVRADYLHLVDMRLRKVRNNNVPFGGLQVTGFGDFFQIEPIMDELSKKHYDKKLYKSHFCFDSPSWNFKEKELTTPHRHANPEHVKLLRSIRCQDENFKDAFSDLLKISQLYEPTSSATVLCSYNNDAEYRNEVAYNRLKTQEKVYFAKESGEKFKDNETSVPKMVKLKKGARVIICANDKDESYVNGSQGYVEEMLPQSVLVRLDNGEIVSVEPFKWEKTDMIREPIGGLTRVVIGTFEQIPLKLGYAISIHKSQGLTFEDLAIDTGRGAFAHGQFYVSISRIKDLEKLQFMSKNINLSNVIVRQRVKEWYSGVN